MVYSLKQRVLGVIVNNVYNGILFITWFTVYF